MSRLRRFRTPPTSSAFLVQGAGFSGATTEPGARGSASDYAFYQRAIANWSCIPHQDITGTFNIGVVAFHAPTAADQALGRDHWVEYVEFSIDNGPWKAVYTPTVNATSGITDFNVPVRAQDLTDGQHEVRAIVYPYVGLPRVLQGSVSSSLATYQFSLYLNSNNGGSFTPIIKYADSVSGNDTTGDGSEGNPYATLYRARTAVRTAAAGNDVGGHFVYLKAGNYAHTSTDSVEGAAATRYLTIMPAPGVPKADVIINTSGVGNGIRIRKEKLKGLTITAPGDIASAFEGAISASSTGNTIWLDDVDYTGTDRDADCIIYTANSWDGGIFITGGTYSNCIFGPTHVTIGIGYTVTNYGSDAFAQGRTLINCTASALTQTVGSHPDVWQVYRTGGIVQNCILYGVIANTGLDTQLLFFDDTPSGHEDIAVINCNMAQDNAGRNSIQSTNPVKHVLLSNSTFDCPNPSLSSCTDCCIVDTLWLDETPPAAAGLTFRP